jgi:cytochrome c oxidase subunit II
MINWYVERAGSYAADVDNLIMLVTVLVGFWFFVSEIAFFWFLWRYRHQKGVTKRSAERPDSREGSRGGAGHAALYITGEEHQYTRWIHWPHYAIIACDLVIIAGAVRVWYMVKQDLPPADDTVRVITQQWAWTFVQSGPDGKLDTADDIRTIDELHVETGKTYHYELTSLDVLHDFSVPVFRLKQDAIPGRYIKGWFKPTKTGVHDIQCAEICGVGHGLMNATIYIESAEDHAKWNASHSLAMDESSSPVGSSTGGLAMGSSDAGRLTGGLASGPSSTGE